MHLERHHVDTYQIMRGYMSVNAVITPGEMDVDELQKIWCDIQGSALALAQTVYDSDLE